MAGIETIYSPYGLEMTVITSDKPILTNTIVNTV